MKKTPKGNPYAYLTFPTDVSSGTNIHASNVNRIHMSLDPNLHPGGVNHANDGGINSDQRTGISISGHYGSTMPAGYTMWQVRHHGAAERFNFYDHEGKQREVESQEYELYVSEKDAEAHVDLEIMRKQFLEDLAERGMTEQEYLKRFPQPEMEDEPEALAPTVTHGERMLDFSSILFSCRARELVVEPIISDYQLDMQEALAAGASTWKLRAIQARYWLAYIVGFLDEVLPVVGRLWRALGGP